MAVRGRLAFDDQGRLVEIAEDAQDPTNPQPDEIQPVEFAEIITDGLSADSVSIDSVSFAGKPWFDVTEYGAVGDGATDDGPALQAAMDDAGATDGMGVVYYPTPSDGYLSNQELTVPSETVHVSPRPWTGATVIVGPEVGGGEALFRNTAGFNDIYFWGIEGDGSQGWEGASYQPAQKIFYFRPGGTDDGTKNFAIEKCYAHDTPATAIGCDSIINQHYRHNIVENAGTDGETTGGNGIGIGVGEVSGSCPTWIADNWVIDTAEFGIILEQTGDNVRSHDYHIRDNSVVDARIGIGVELIRGGDISGNTLVLSDRMERCVWVDSLDSFEGPDQISVTNNHVADPNNADGSAVAAFEFGSDATFCVGSNNTIEVGVKFDTGNRVVNNGAWCAWGGVGKEAAGSGNTPTRINRWASTDVQLVENTDDNTLWYSDDSGTWRQIV